MTTSVKVLIIVGSCVLLGVLAVVAAGVFWWARHGGELMQAGKNAMQDGAKFGRSTDNQGCLDEALLRQKRDTGFGGVLSTDLFLSSCLDSSRATPGFCDGVPWPIDFIRGAQWQMEKCKEAHSDDPYCRQLFSQVQQYCERVHRIGDGPKQPVTKLEYSWR